MNLQIALPTVFLITLVANRVLAQVESTGARPPADYVVQMIEVKNGDTLDMANMLNALQMADDLAVSPQKEANVLILRGKKAKVEEATRLISELEEAARERALDRQSRGFVIRPPSNTKLTWTGGDGILTSNSSGGGRGGSAILTLTTKRGSTNILRLSQIASYPQLIVEIEASRLPWDERTGNALAAGPEVTITATDLQNLNDGWSVTKYITGPHKLSVEHPEVFESVTIKNREGSLVQVKLPKDYVAVFTMKGVTLPDSATPAGPDAGGPSAPRPKVSNPFGRGNTQPSNGTSELTPPPQGREKAAPGALGPFDFDNPFITSADFPVIMRAAEEQIQHSFAQLKLAYKNKLSNDTVANLEETLRLAINRSFEIRQHVQLAEIELQRNKLVTLHARVQQRAEQAGGLIEQRFKQLLQQAKE